MITGPVGCTRGQVGLIGGIFVGGTGGAALLKQATVDPSLGGSGLPAQVNVKEKLPTGFVSSPCIKT